MLFFNYLRSKAFILLIILSLTGACAVHSPLPKDYFSNNHRVGVVYNFIPKNLHQSGSLFRHDMAAAKDKDYLGALELLASEFSVPDSIHHLYQTAYLKNGKTLNKIDIKVVDGELKILNNPDSLRKQFNIDEILLVNVEYGLAIEYDNAIVTHRQGYCSIDSEIIDLNNLTELYKSQSEGNAKLQRKIIGDPSDEELSKAMIEAIDEAIHLELAKFTPN